MSLNDMRFILTLFLAACLGLSSRAGVIVHPDSLCGKVKPLNAVNNGPIVAGVDQKRSNAQTYKAACIPFARTHDSNMCANYGGPHTVDISCIFPDFKADERKPSSYDFTNTDLYLSQIRDAGTEVFFRLGQSIEHTKRKYGAYPPEDFRKWARICEHIIRHYNEGWADGFHWNIRYWEIWNEPDLDSEDYRLVNPRTWAGTDRQFYDLFEISAKHLKKCFPDLKIGGPASCGRLQWCKDFLTEMKARQVPLDFFSWHIYKNDPSLIVEKARKFRALLDEAGYHEAESILNEWNYILNWTDRYVASVETISNVKGASFMAAVMAALQTEPVDMAMYYDFRPSVFCGPFDFYTLRPRVPYYAFYAWSRLAGGKSAAIDIEGEKDIYAVASIKPDGGFAVLVVRYNDDSNVVETKDVSLEIKGMDCSRASCYLTDASRRFTGMPVSCDAEGRIILEMAPCSFALIEF